jgi:outer membrane protein TolC
MRWPEFCLSFILCPISFAASGQALPLDEAVALALERAPEVAARGEGLAAARELAVSAGRLPDPALVIGVDNLPVEGPDAWSTTSDFMTMRRIGLMQAFPAREKRRFERERASAGVELADAELAATRLDIAREATSAWIRRAAMESALRDLEALRADVELGAAAARAGVAAARETTAEALAAETQVVRFGNRIRDMETEAHHARIELARWIGTDAERPLGGMPDLDRLFEPAPALLADAGRHGALLPFEAQLAAAQADVELARAGRRPDWSAEIAYAKRGPEFSDMASLQFTVGLPFFARNRQDPVIAARSADLRRLEAERETTIRAHAAELRKMLLEWEQAGVQLDQYDRELLPLARERAKAALASYRAGRGGLQPALDAFEDEIEATIERALLADQRGRAWAYLRYLDPRQLQP